MNELRTIRELNIPIKESKHCRKNMEGLPVDLRSLKFRADRFTFKGTKILKIKAELGERQISVFSKIYRSY